MNASETITGGRITKVERYGWQLQDTPGRFMMLSKTAIEIDPKYQRDLAPAKVKQIASDWSWVAFGSATVAQRPDGSFFAIDAQHRILAAQRRSDIDMLPCMVFRTESVAEEARGFLSANTLRKPLSGLDKHRAKIVTVDPDAVALDHILSAAGYRAENSSSASGTLKAVAVCTNLAGENADALAKVFHVLAHDLDHHYAHERLVSTLWFLQSRGFVELTDKRTRKRISAVGASGLIEAAGRASAYHAKGGMAIWAEGITNALNKGMRNKISTYTRNE